MTYPSELPHVSSYVDLIDRFIGRDISAPDFEKSFLQAMKSERRTLGDPVYPILQELFEDADAYVEQAELRTEPEDLDDEQLRASALRARHALSGLGYEWVNGEVFFASEIKAMLALGVPCRVGPRGRYRRYGQISREDRIRRDQYRAAGVLRDRQRRRCSHLPVLGLGDPDC